MSSAPDAAPIAGVPLDRVAPVSGTTQRQAISAASAMAGASTRKAPNKPQRRQWLLAAVALVVLYLARQHFDARSPLGLVSFGLLFGGGWEWVADLTGFATGFLLSFVVSPGGWARVRDKIRQR